jgi:fructose-bisphosphate aldolase, class I
MMEELRELVAGSEVGRPRGRHLVLSARPMLDKVGETALDICAYAAHMAALLGAHIIKVKPPTDVRSSARCRQEDLRVRTR